MLRKSIKYVLIILVNLILLTIMLAIWTDDFELEFNILVRPIEFLKLIGISIIGLISLTTSILIFRKFKINRVKTRINISVILILILSSYFYVDYSNKIYNNRISKGEFRNEIMKKIEPINNNLGRGTKAEKLTQAEYSEITKLYWFKNVPRNAENIEYFYVNDEFLPDYSFSLSYDVPKESMVDTLNHVNGAYSEYQSFKILGNKKRVTYYELRK